MPEKQLIYQNGLLKLYSYGDGFCVEIWHGSAIKTGYGKTRCEAHDAALAAYARSPFVGWSSHIPYGTKPATVEDIGGYLAK